METIINPGSIQMQLETDVLVVGAGSSGCVAALAAAEKGREKHKVMLIERYGFPGGASTQVLDTFYGFFIPGDHPRKIVGGWPDQVVNELYRLKKMFLRPNTYGAGTGVTYDPERLKKIWEDLLLKEGVRLILHSTLIEAVPAEDDRYCCVFWHKGGFYKVLAKRVIDASGDADFSHLVGLEYEIAGEQEIAQSMTTTFRMNNVDLQRYREKGGKRMLVEKMSEAVESGNYPLPRKKGSIHEMVGKNSISTVTVKIAGYSGLDAFDLTEAELRGRDQVFLYEDFLTHEVPGFEHSDIMGISTQIGVRETRRVYGLHRLTKEECLTAHKPEDRIFLCGAPIEDHRYDPASGEETHWEYIAGDGIYGVPYGTIVPRGGQLSWCVGRCFSATHDAHASCRSMAQTMSMGQAAGLAAIQSLERNCGAAEVNVAELQTDLLSKGTILDVPLKEADISRNGWMNNF